METSALLAIVAAEPEAERMVAAIPSTEDKVLPAHCLVEAHIVLTARFPPAMMETLDRVMAALRLRILIPFTDLHADAARAAFDAYGKGRHPAGLNFGDCMSYAVAQAEGAPLLFVGEDFGRTDVARVEG